MGSVTGVFVDARDHVWITHLPETLTEEELYEEQTPPMATCCKAAPTVIELDQNGKVVQGWGEKAKDDPANWPRNPHGIFVDHTDHVWVGSHMHHRVMKFTRQGKLVLTVGAVRQEQRQRRHDAARRPVGHLGRSEDQRGLHLRRLPQPPGDRRRRRDRRLQAALGRLRQPARRHREVRSEDDARRGRCPRASRPRTASPARPTASIYVADRRGNRIQVFEQSGKFVTEKILAPATLSSGSAFVPVLSKDPQQQWLYLADGTNHKVWVLRRSTMEVVGEFGRGGRQLGQFLRPHGMSIDSKGNLYVGEASTGRRVQRFLVTAAALIERRPLWLAVALPSPWPS